MAPGCSYRQIRPGLGHRRGTRAYSRGIGTVNRIVREDGLHTSWPRPRVSQETRTRREMPGSGIRAKGNFPRRARLLEGVRPGPPARMQQVKFSLPVRKRRPTLSFSRGRPALRPRPQAGRRRHRGREGRAVRAARPAQGEAGVAQQKPDRSPERRLRVRSNGDEVTSSRSNKGSGGFGVGTALLPEGRHGCRPRRSRPESA